MVIMTEDGRSVLLKRNIPTEIMNEKDFDTDHLNGLITEEDALFIHGKYLYAVLMGYEPFLSAHIDSNYTIPITDTHIENLYDMTDELNYHYVDDVSIILVDPTFRDVMIRFKHKLVIHQDDYNDWVSEYFQQYTTLNVLGCMSFGYIEWDDHAVFIVIDHEGAHIQGYMRGISHVARLIKNNNQVKFLIWYNLYEPDVQPHYSI